MSKRAALSDIESSGTAVRFSSPAANDWLQGWSPDAPAGGDDCFVIAAMQMLTSSTMAAAIADA